MSQFNPNINGARNPAGGWTSTPMGPGSFTTVQTVNVSRGASYFYRYPTSSASRPTSGYMVFNMQGTTQDGTTTTNAPNAWAARIVFLGYPNSGVKFNRVTMELSYFSGSHRYCLTDVVNAGSDFYGISTLRVFQNQATGYGTLIDVAQMYKNYYVAFEIYNYGGC